jgi:Arc/MetJ family transcription regulator
VSRTNIDIDDAKLDVVMRRYGLRTKTEAVDLALAHLAGIPLTLDEALARHGAGAIRSLPDEDPVVTDT